MRTSRQAGVAKETISKIHIRGAPVYRAKERLIDEGGNQKNADTCLGEGNVRPWNDGNGRM